jgi:3-deoxy-D-manno-octulosonic-acid transferase
MVYDLVVLPLLFILRGLVIPWIPKARTRVFYEKQSRHFKGSRSFHDDQLTADIAFEFSSEGEFQQCLPLIQESLKSGQKIELIYFSPSVEKGVQGLYHQYPEQIRLLNFPLLTYGLGRDQSVRRWMTSKKLILTRYDFFPEILLWARHPENKLILIWASFKRKRLKDQMLSWYQLLFLKASRQVIAATVEDKDYLQKQGLLVESVFDFRLVQIHERIALREKTLHLKFPQWDKFHSFFSSFAPEHRLLVGNAWPVDLDLFTDEYCEQIEQRKKICVIVPHLVGTEHAPLWREKLKELNLKTIELYPDSDVDALIKSYQQSSGVMVIHLKGILCELYTDFKHAYIGGGHGVSVHSLLEPFVAGSQLIACGPRVERSTEFDLCNQKFEVVSLLKERSDFKQWIEKQTGDNLEEREKNLQMMKKIFDQLRARLELC